MFDLGPTSRAELARKAGVNRTTISGIVQPLIDRQILEEGVSARSGEGGGKPGRPLWFSPEAQPICGVLLMPGSVRAGLVTLAGAISVEETAPVPTDGRHRGEVLATIGACIESVLKHARRPPLGIGVVAGGMVDTERRMVVASNLAPALDGLPLGDDVERRFGLPVMLDHHPRALLVGDRWFGKGRGLRDCAVIYSGEVMGGALYLDGHLRRGAFGAGGELGHTFVQVDGELCRCGRRGCWDTIATLGWLRREAAAAGLSEPGDITSARLVAAMTAGDERAGKLLVRYARNIAVGIANLQQSVAPNVFILHGDVVGGGAPLRNAIAQQVSALVPRRPGVDLAIELGTPGDDAALMGAAGLVLSHLLQLPL
ncbi:MAG TPA: ROK family protein [Lichenihabitans sp.]|nr:ROK family protein [Lichenihabitans sp.]